MRKYKLKGEMYVDTMISVLIICIVLTLCLSVLPILIYKYQLDVMASQISKNISVDGIYSLEQIIDVQDSFGEVGQNADIEIILKNKDGKSETLDVEKNNKIQLADKFTVVIKYNFNVNFGGITRSDITLSANSTGRSEVYWKELAY